MLHLTGLTKTEPRILFCYNDCLVIIFHFCGFSLLYFSNFHFQQDFHSLIICPVPPHRMYKFVKLFMDKIHFTHTMIIFVQWCLQHSIWKTSEPNVIFLIFHSFFSDKVMLVCPLARQRSGQSSVSCLILFNLTIQHILHKNLNCQGLLESAIR